MGLRSRAKGKRGELEVVALARAHGLGAERTWHLAQSSDPSERCSDVKNSGKAYQVKRERDGFGKLYASLENVAGLFLRADNQGWLVVLRAEDYLQLPRRGHSEEFGGMKMWPILIVLLLLLIHIYHTLKRFEEMERRIGESENDKQQRQPLQGLK